MPATGSPSRNPCLPGPNRSSAIAEVLMRCKGLASVAEENVGVGGLEAPDGAFQNFVAPGPERLVAAALASHLEDGHLWRVDSPDEAPGIGIEAVVEVGLAGERTELGDRDPVAGQIGKAACGERGCE